MASARSTRKRTRSGDFLDSPQYGLETQTEDRSGRNPYRPRFHRQTSSVEEHLTNRDYFDIDSDEVTVPALKRTRVETPGRTDTTTFRGVAHPESQAQKTNNGQRRVFIRDDYTAPLQEKECIICRDDVALERFPRAPHTGDRRRCRNVCGGCWEEHLQTQLERQDLNKMSCPECDEALKEPEIKRLNINFRENIYEQWLDKAAKHCREGDEAYRACPSNACTWGCFMSRSQDGNIFKCQSCNYRYCIDCEVEMHTDKSCADFQADLLADERKQKEERLSKRAVRDISKPCPSCHTNLEKIGGCDHITCSHCRHEFCWLCFADYNGQRGVRTIDNAAHARTCSYYAPNPNVQAQMPVRPAPMPLGDRVPRRY